jgi:hypothetical protein
VTKTIERAKSTNPQPEHLHLYQCQTDHVNDDRIAGKSMVEASGFATADVFWAHLHEEATTMRESVATISVDSP